MNKTISASAMRDRLLERLQNPRKNEEWFRVLGVQGHRDLFGLIVRHGPPSIGALSELAGRSQPNVSRSLSALVAAGLVNLVSAGRCSIPQITESGAARARELGLNEAVAVEPAPIRTPRLFRLELDQSAVSENPSDLMEGRLTSWLGSNLTNDEKSVWNSGDMDALGRRLLDNWWRVLYRRDAPHRLWDVGIEGQAGMTCALIASVLGDRVNLSVRKSAEFAFEFEPLSKTISIQDFERDLLEEFLRPLASSHRLKGRTARPFHSLLQRIEDSRIHPNEAAFCRTVGALGMTPYELTDDCRSQIHDLLGLVPDEDARNDFASAVLADGLSEARNWVTQQLEFFQQRNAMQNLEALRAKFMGNRFDLRRPYQRGYALAKAFRVHLKLAEDQPIGGIDGLSKLVGAAGTIGLSPSAPGSLRGFQSMKGDCPTIIVQDEGQETSTFVFARGIGDFIAFGGRASCVANLYTDRQAVGRAFAAEFLAPRAAVVRMVEEEDQPEMRVASHFGVHGSLVHRQYANRLH